MTDAKALGSMRSNDHAKMFLLRTKSIRDEHDDDGPCEARLKRMTSAALCVQNIESPEASGMVG